jgi:hypothetical protein
MAEENFFTYIVTKFSIFSRMAAKNFCPRLEILAEIFCRMSEENVCTYIITNFAKFSKDSCRKFMP